MQTKTIIAYEKPKTSFQDRITDSDVHVVNMGLVKDIEKVIGRFDCVPFVCFKSSLLLCSKVCIHD